MQQMHFGMAIEIEGIFEIADVEPETAVAPGAVPG